MPKGDKYIRLTKFLQTSDEETLTLSLKQIEDIIGDSLPLSANQHRAFWSNTRTHSVAFGWMDANYKTTIVDIENELITFERE